MVHSPAAFNTKKSSTKAQTASAMDKLFGVRQGEQAASGFKLIEHDRIEVVAQPRTAFTKEELGELAQSIVELRGRGQGIEATGVLQPLLVMPLKNSNDETAAGNESMARPYRLIAGERRYRASQQAGLPHVPCLVVAMKEDGVLLAQLIENLQRQDLSPLDEARSLQQLMVEQGLSYRDTAPLIGKSRSYISDRLALLMAGQDVKDMVSARADTLHHARIIEAVTNPALRKELISATLDGSGRREIERRIQEYERQVTTENVVPVGSAVAQPQASIRTDSISHRDSPATPNTTSLDRPNPIRHDDENIPKERVDPVTQCLDPAVALLSEGLRHLQNGRLSHNYAQEVRRRIEQVRAQIEKIEKVLE